jgi:hypothetical protein
MQTPEGAKKALETIYKRHGKDYFKRVGSLGGSKSRGGGYASNKRGDDGLTGKERAKLSGSLGGRKSRRGPAKYYTYKGKQMSITAIAREMGVARATAYKRLEIS